MEYRRDRNDYVIRFDRGEDIIVKLAKFAELEDIQLAEVSAIGATNNLTVGVYDLENKEYKSNDYSGDFEIASLNGNLTTKDGKPYLHLHGVFSNSDGLVVAGHVNKAVISVTCEMFVRVVEGKMDRALDSEIGINLMKFN